jgi:hypothetical protein
MKSTLQLTIQKAFLSLLCVASLFLVSCAMPAQNSELNEESMPETIEITDIEYHNNILLLSLFLEDMNTVLSRLDYTQDDLTDLPERSQRYMIQLKKPVVFENYSFDLQLHYTILDEKEKFIGVVYHMNLPTGKEAECYTTMKDLYSVMKETYGAGDTQLFDMNFTDSLSEKAFTGNIGKKHFYHDWPIDRVDSYYIRLICEPVRGPEGVNSYNIQIQLTLGYQMSLPIDYGSFASQIKDLQD